MKRPSRETLLTVRGLYAGYRPGLPILHGAELDLRAGEIVSVIGPNGAGKSTLVKAVAGLVPVSAGEVLYRGRDIRNRPAHELPAAGIAYVPQNRNIFTTLSVHHNLCLAGHTLGRGRDRRIAHSYRQFPLLAEKRADKGGTLSGGQRQTLALAMALLAEPGLVMLDEPTAGLAPRVAGEVFERLRGLAERGVAVLLVEQNARAALKVSDRGYVFAEGRNRLHGAAAALLADPAVAEIYLGVSRP